MFLPRGSIFLLPLLAIALLFSILYAPTLHVVSEESTQQETVVIPPVPLPFQNKVLINLSQMTITLVDTTSTTTFPVISKGKPGSYYETPGGIYENDYKEPSHFSSIGHVYMPWSVHIFGNFFIHGIPYYPNGSRVDSTYSGGCIRLADADAKKVYDFVSRGTPIIITQNSFDDFTGAASGDTVESLEMTRYMVATISLEFLTQDTKVFFNEGVTTRRNILYDLLTLHDDSVSLFLSSPYGKEYFVRLMNQKAKAIGLRHTLFTAVNTPAKTTAADAEAFKTYLEQYKAYLFSPDITGQQP